MYEDILKEHFDLTSEVLELLQNENKILKSPDGELDSSFNDYKTNLFQRLQKSIQSLKSLTQEAPIEGLHSKEIIRATEKKLMKIFLLDRENESLLLQHGYQKQTHLNFKAVPKSKASQTYSKT